MTLYLLEPEFVRSSLAELRSIELLACDDRAERDLLSRHTGDDLHVFVWRDVFCHGIDALAYRSKEDENLV